VSIDPSFRFSLPPSTEGMIPVTAEEFERILRGRIAGCLQGSREHRDATWQLVRLLGTTGRSGEGLRELENLLATALDLAEKAEIVLASGQLMEKHGDFPSAIQAYRRGIGLEPVQARAWYLLHNNLGYSLNQLGRYDEGERWCRAAIQIDPERHNAYKNLGVACDGQGRYGEAIHCFIAAVKAEATDPRALRHLEDLIERHPGVRTEMPDLDHQLEMCRAAVTAARQVWSAACPPEPGTT
jgi:tetratricopeptide (TPR) repeat protein